MTKGIAGFIRDNLEAFAVAIAMALVIRHYCLEAFRIPTKSMMPTLLGDDNRNHGDRILVDKYVYLRREPRRFEVVVFQFPLNKSKNYIKRLVGLPGEKLRIVDGDVWVLEGERWVIQRKPGGVRDQLFFPFYPRLVDEAGRTFVGSNWEADKEWLVSERDERFKVDAATDGPSVLRFARELVPYDSNGLSGSEGLLVGDVRVSFDLRVERAGTLVVRLQEHGRPHRLVLGKDKSYAVVARDDKEHEYPLDVRLRDGQELTVRFANVDDTLLLEIDGDVEAEFEREFPDPPSKPAVPPWPEGPKFDDGWWDHEIAFQANGLKATIEHVRIDRDLYYNAESWSGNKSPDYIWDIPEDHFFMLGDNTRHSSDSRAWVLEEVVLDDGTVIRYQNDPRETNRVESPDGEVLILADVDGLRRRFRLADEAGSEHKSQPFVPRENLVGRAFAIFWPIHLPRIYGGGTRINLIR